mmetsp:Transcript_14773/g.39586  ORF Transcript_14773/g.39586 Transcript_14773/m.39586 type:complete len:229 (+) Transcript_14773:1619-2305(+)
MTCRAQAMAHGARHRLARAVDLEHHTGLGNLKLRITEQRVFRGTRRVRKLIPERVEQASNSEQSFQRRLRFRYGQHEPAVVDVVVNRGPVRKAFAANRAVQRSFRPTERLGQHFQREKVFVRLADDAADAHLHERRFYARYAHHGCFKCASCCWLGVSVGAHPAKDWKLIQSQARLVAILVLRQQRAVRRAVLAACRIPHALNLFTQLISFSRADVEHSVDAVPAIRI